MNHIRIRTALAATLAALITMPVLASAPALAADGVLRTGSCSGRSDWKLAAKHRDGRIEVELEVDSNRVGQTWAWALRHNGAVSARGTAVTRAPSGSFSRDRNMVNLGGPDRIGLFARNIRSGEWCSGALQI